MAGLFNSGTRDFCGDESSITKLSHHFSRDYALKEEGLNDSKWTSSGQTITTTFKLDELLKSVEASNKVLPNNLNIINKEVVIGSNNNQKLSSQPNGTVNQNELMFIVPSYFTIPQPVFSSHDHSLLANEWARYELSQFDNSIITEDDLKVLSESNDHNQYNARFSDVIRNMTLEDESKEINISDENLKNLNDEFLYDLDQDLRIMRDKLMSNEQSMDLWPHFFNDFKNVSNEFSFIKNNHYAETIQNEKENQSEKADDMLSKGIKLYQEGYFSEAMLIFEGVVQVKPNSESGWHYLALSLSENEQDQKALMACKRCLEINPRDQEILLSLARIHCNDMNIVSTVTCLERWLLANPKYVDLATVGQEAALNIGDTADIDYMDDDGFESRGKFGIIEQQLNTAKERNGFNIDPDLEIALGTLYHVIQDYCKSSVHFESAAIISANNALLWNKLGTSYCNSGEFNKAIETYQKALKLAPGFVRAECNLGVSFYNMGHYSDAIKHALRAFKLQHSAMSIVPQSFLNSRELSDSVVETDPIWTLIRMSCFKMDRSDLDLVVFSRDVDTLSKEFDG